ncbi:MAG: hypothetical protein DSZ07_04330 [Sulfurovum sp.]|nr:MAG: hypothetical protein DSZ07_04330 [Sulfurovum sp.]
MEPKQLFSTIAIILVFVAYYPYIKSILNNETKPHLFSWIIWGLTTSIVFFALLSNKGGVGSFPTGVSALICFFIAFISYKKVSHDVIQKSDWVFFILALLAIPLWYMTNSALNAVILLSIIDTLGFIPTFKKTYHSPYEEQLSFFILMVIKEFFAVSALEEYSLTTLLFPIVLSSSTIIFILMVYGRRMVIKKI